jgi:hypothetical protein
MTRGILIAGNESALTAAIEAEAAKRVEHFASALIPNRLTALVDNKNPPMDARLVLSWNPGSPVSARTLILAAENRLEHINEAILVCAPPAVHKHPGDLISTDIEIMVNDHIKGWFFLVKELAVAFKARKAGTLALVLSDMESGNGTPDLLGASAAASFWAFTQGLLASAAAEPFQIMGFSTANGSTDDAGFAGFIFKLLEEGGKRNNGKWHKFGKLGFFGR